MKRQSTRIIAAWTVAWLVTASLIAVTQYGSRDPDSQLYAGMSARMVREPVARWIAPEWWGFWNTEGPYYEHPVGMFVVPAALGRAGYPPEQAAYAVNSFYQISAFALIALIASSVLSRRDAHALGWMLQLLPIAFVFRVRANQEYAVLAGLLFALYATERARTRPPWALGMLAGLGAVLVVKGVFAFIVPVTCGLWLFARAGSPAAQWQVRPLWLVIAAMPLAAALAVWGYESAYVAATGRSFLAVYQSRQMPDDALTAGSPVVRAAYTGTWYLSRIIWYAFPWSLAAAVVAGHGLRTKRWWPWSDRPVAKTNDAPQAWQGAWFAIVAAIALTTAFSLAHRKADRYIFPVYFLVGAAGAGAALRRFPRVSAVADRLDRPWFPPLLYVLLAMLTLLSSGKLPQFTFWRT